MSLARLGWRSLAARRLRTCLTIAGIALGVGMLFTSLLVGAAVDTAGQRIANEILGRADLRVAAIREAGLGPASLAAIEGATGVATAAPKIVQRVYLEPEALGAEPAAPVTLVGVDPESYAAAHDLVVVEGSGIMAGGREALITERLAAADGLAIGDEITIAAGGSPQTLRIGGIVAGEGPDPGAAGRIVIAPIERVATALDRHGPTHIDVVLAGGATAADVERAFEAALTAEPYVLSDAADLAASLGAATADFRATTALIAAIALFGGAFVIFNTLSMTLAERARDVGLLRAAGATRRQVAGFVLAGAAVLGAAGSLLGLVVGAILARLVSAWVAPTGPAAGVAGGGLQIDSPAVGGAAVAIAVVVGLLVTFAAALEPAWRAGRISPVDALRPRADLATTNPARLRWLVGVFAVVAVVGILAWPHTADAAGPGRALAIYAVFLAAALLAPLVLAPLARLAGAPFVLFATLEERLARGSLARDPSRTALTVGALMVGLALIVALGAIAQNARRATAGWLDGVVPGEVVVTSIRPIALDEPVVDALDVPGVDRISPIATFEIAARGRAIDAAAVVGSDLLEDGRLDFVAGSREAALQGLDGGGTVVLPRSQAERLGLGLGDTVEVASGDGDAVRLAVTGVVERSLPADGGEAVLVSWTDATEALGVLGADSFAVRYVPGRETDARPALDAAAAENALETASVGQVDGAIAGALGRVFGLFDMLAVVAVVVAALGVVNTLWMSVAERVREIGVLRATGMTRGRVARMVVVEAGILGFVGSVLGVVVGLAASTLLLGLSAGHVGLPVDPPWITIALALALGIGLSMAAAWQPARLASRVSIVRAVQYE